MVFKGLIYHFLCVAGLENLFGNSNNMFKATIEKVTLQPPIRRSTTLRSTQIMASPTMKMTTFHMGQTSERPKTPKPTARWYPKTSTTTRPRWSLQTDRLTTTMPSSSLFSMLGSRVDPFLKKLLESAITWHGIAYGSPLFPQKKIGVPLSHAQLQHGLQSFGLDSNGGQNFKVFRV